MKLLDHVRRACRTKHLSLRTEKAYVSWARRFVRYHGTRHPRELREADVRAFLAFALMFAGNFRVTISKQGIPAKYADVAQSTLTVKVKPGDNKINLELKN